MSGKRRALDMVREELREITTTAEVSNPSIPARLLANESALNPSFLLQQALRELGNLEPNRYWLPEASTDLLEELASYTRFDKEWLLLGNGADELILMTMLTFLRPGDSIAMAWPSYPMYPYLSEVLGMQTVKVPIRRDFSLDVEGMLTAAHNYSAPLIILANPNNPTGNLFDRDELRRLIEQSDSIVAIDEAYFEYTGETAADWVRDYDRLIVWRTFSKAFSLAGMRIGYLIAQPELVREMYKARLPFNLSNLSQWMAKAALEQKDVFMENVRLTVLERERVQQALCKMQGVTTYSSVTNFLLFKTDRPASVVYEHLVNNGVLIRQVESASPLLAGCLRVSIGTPKENDLFLTSLGKLF